MIYRIDIQRFLLHAIDHFSFTDLYYCQYVIVSSRIKCGNKDGNCHKANPLYPLPETVARFAETGNTDLLDRELFALYDDMIKHDHSTVFYDLFVRTIETHTNVMVVCHEDENPYVDSLCKFLKKRFSIEVINLNQLFTKGKIDPVHYDYNKIRDKGVDIRRAATAQAVKDKASTEEGRMELLMMWKRKTKLNLCKSIGINVRKDVSDKDLDAILIDAWVKDDGW